MSTALWLFALQGVLGAFDTLYYHEWKARLPAHVPGTRPELLLHATRDFFYALLFATLPWLSWRGAWAAVLGAVIAAEIVITLADFVVEDRVRAPLGGVFPGERCTHAVMALLYGAVLAHVVPELLAGWRLPTQLTLAPVAIPEGLRLVLGLMAVGVFGSGVRDLYAALRLPGGHWPWPAPQGTPP
ncbi:hypothetical protein [Melittangium boletus]|uniref:Uncharacterized protein n=1 Tax=Melittangium boletus DSM 14713 TaxID=1294270 RepID=A0A250IAV6_9BACT|nr:hypothetical protein [Melittangium boletus]ATB28340.1 hypothetical protein MEBOL_001786 [Melittangium boletus DSM 14713]